MSDSWITGSNRLEKAGLSQADIDAIEVGINLNLGSVEKRLIRVMPDGTTKTTIIK